MGNNHIYIISYELHSSFFRDYKPLYDAIKSYGVWMHHVENSWLIVTHQDAKAIFNHLGKHIKTDDRLIIARITNDYFGWLPQEAWDWIDRHAHHLNQSHL